MTVVVKLLSGWLALGLAIAPIFIALTLADASSMMGLNHMTKTTKKMCLSIVDWDVYTTCQTANLADLTQPNSQLPTAHADHQRMFNKHYSSVVQRLARQKVFMARVMEVFATGLKYKLNQIGYFTMINKYSDLTAQETRRMLSGDSSGLSSGDVGDFADEQVARAVLLEDLSEQQQEEPIGNNTGEEVSSKKKKQLTLKRQQNCPPRRKKRSLDEDVQSNEAQDQLPNKMCPNELVQVPVGLHQTPSGGLEQKLNIQWIVPSDNQYYRPLSGLDLGSLAGVTSNMNANIYNDLTAEEMKEASSNKATVYLPSMISNSLSSLTSSVTNAFDWITSPPQMEEIVEEVAEKRRKELEKVKEDYDDDDDDEDGDEDKVVVDWRRSSCIGQPRDQGPCESCYAVSSMGFVEWALCMNQARVLTPLSVQYMVSCGPQLKAETGGRIDLNGCQRGLSKQTMHFVKEYGVELEAHMPYLAEDTECPLEPGLPAKYKGYIRPNIKPPVRLRPTTDQLDLALKKGPVVVSFREPVNFLAYGGGLVDSCHPEGGHAMLIVGSGVENGHEYLLIKNSFGTDWGLDGFFKFKRSSVAECVKEFISPRVSFPSRRSQNRRIKAYLAEMDTYERALDDDENEHQDGHMEINQLFQKE